VLKSVLNAILYERITLKLKKDKSKAIPIQAWTGREGSRRLRLPDFVKVVSPTHWPPLPPGNIPGTHFC
jgi:hypothetical protein